jgi:hypothetical protein
METLFTYDNISHNYSYNESFLDKSCRENQNAHFIFKTLFRKSSVYEIKWKKYQSRTGYSKQYNMAHARCVRDN